MVRVHFGPPLLQLTINSWQLRNWLKSQRNLRFHWVSWKRDSKMHLENWTLKLLMQLWEGNSKGKLLIKRVINTILLKTSNYWACIILLEKPDWKEWIFLLGQANKSARGMPWHQEPMKDVISCDKLRGVANILWSGDFRMGKPTARYRMVNQIAIRGEPPELKHLSRARKRHQPRFRE